MSSTAFVKQTPYADIGISTSPLSMVRTIVDDVNTFKDAQIIALNTAIINLENVISKYEPRFDPITTVIPGITIPAFPDKPDLNFQPNENWPTNDIPNPFIRANNPDFSFIEPVPPGSLDPSFNYTPGVYTSCLWSDLCSTVRDSLINGGTGLTDSVYALIIERNQEARRNIEDETRQRAYDAVGETGFNLAGGQAAAVILELEKDIIAKDLDAVNSTTIKDFDLADTNTRFTKELSLKMEEVAVLKFNSNEDRLFEIAKVTKEFIIAVRDQNVKIFLGQWEGVKNKIEAAKAQSEVIIAINDGEIKVFLGRIEAFSKEIDAISAENKSRSDVTLAEASIYETEIKAIAIQISAEVEIVRSKIDEYRLELEEVLEKEKINLAAYTSSTELTERVAESLANIAAQSVASALGALNASSSMGYNSSESLAYHESLSNTLSEGHVYEEE